MTKQNPAGGWDATSYVQKSHDEAPESLLGSNDESFYRLGALSGQPGVVGKPGPSTSNQCRGLYMLPLEYTTSSDEAEAIFCPSWSLRCYLAAWTTEAAQMRYQEYPNLVYSVNEVIWFSLISS